MVWLFALALFFSCFLPKPRSFFSPFLFSPPSASFFSLVVAAAPPFGCQARGEAHGSNGPRPGPPREDSRASLKRKRMSRTQTSPRSFCVSGSSLPTFHASAAPLPSPFSLCAASLLCGVLAWHSSLRSRRGQGACRKRVGAKREHLSHPCDTRHALSLFNFPSAVHLSSFPSFLFSPPSFSCPLLSHAPPVR